MNEAREIHNFLLWNLPYLLSSNQGPFNRDNFVVKQVLFH